MKSKKKTSKDEAIHKLEKYCAYQERCYHEVKTKLSNLGFWGDWADEIIQHLINENFLNQERYAQSFARGKFRIKKWGRNKIRTKMREKRVTTKLIEYGLKEIDEEEYQQTLNYLIHKKQGLIRESDPYKKKQKLINYLVNKGYEFSIILSSLKELEASDLSKQ